jgi:murein L,D-transpeptidase YcbB/YkuD
VKEIKLTTKGIIVLSLLIAFLSARGDSADGGSFIQATDSDLGLLIKKRITEWEISSQKVVGGEPIYAAVLVGGFYRGRNYEPAWRKDGRLIQAEALIKAIEDVYGDGLTPDYYHLGVMKSLVREVKNESLVDPARLADLDILLTDAFLTLGCHLSGGCVNPATMKTGWFAKRSNVDVSSLLEQAIKKREIREALSSLRPAQASYERLRQALALYRERLSSNGEWPQVSPGPRLEKNSVSGRVVELRKRLVASRDMEADEAKGGDLFDAKLQQSVMAFQKRHGLKADGVVGPATLDALNVPLKERVRKIELNMERLRWILGNVEQRSIVVNIANFMLDVVENGKSILSMRVVVGKPYWDTPVFTARMTYLIINPSWNVPESIARREMLKTIKKDPRYLVKQNIKVLRNRGSQEKEVDPKTVDWAKINTKNLPYRFRQEPGPLNPLGRIKFMFPNKFDVYLHDTPAKRLFSESVRTFSHGCTRIEKPLELAEYVLQDQPGWTREDILAAIEEGTEQKIMIPHPLNVHFLYLTAWVDEAGVLQFRNDIYKRDERLDEALRSKPSLL